MSLVLRDVREDDLDVVHSLNQGALPAVGDVRREDIQWFARVAPYFRVAADSNRVHGFLIALTPEVC